MGLEALPTDSDGGRRHTLDALGGRLGVSRDVWGLDGAGGRHTGGEALAVLGDHVGLVGDGDGLVLLGAVGVGQLHGVDVVAVVVGRVVDDIARVAVLLAGLLLLPELVLLAGIADQAALVALVGAHLARLVVAGGVAEAPAVVALGLVAPRAGDGARSRSALLLLRLLHGGGLQRLYGFAG